jgi:hypothetical protein
MITRFEWFEKGNAHDAVEVGILNEKMFSKYIRYKVFLDIKSQGHSENEAMFLTAERMGCSSITVYRDKIFFSR